MIDLGSITRSDADPTFGEILHERLRVTLPWYRVGFTHRVAKRWARDVSHVVDTTVGTSTALRDLTAVDRAVALVSVALAERPEVVAIEVSDALPNSHEHRKFLTAVTALTPARTTIILSSEHGVGQIVDAEPTSGANESRQWTELRLDLTSSAQLTTTVKTFGTNPRDTPMQKGSAS